MSLGRSLRGDMRSTRVASSVIAEVRYDDEQEPLEVLFYNGRVYRYLGVPAEGHDALVHSERSEESG